MTELPLHPEETEEEKLFRRLQTKGLIDLLGIHLPNIEGRLERRYLQARVRVNDHALGIRCQDFVRETGIEISADAQNLIKTVLDAVLSDPHRRWKATPEERVEIVGRYILDLPTSLTTLANEENVEGQITTFDLLHWISRDKHLAKICIIDE